MVGWCTPMSTHFPDAFSAIFNTSLALIFADTNLLFQEQTALLSQKLFIPVFCLSYTVEQSICSSDYPHCIQQNDESQTGELFYI
jgi:hypothetical protein